MVSTTMLPTATNSLCQFWNDWNQKVDVVTKSHGAHRLLPMSHLLGAVLPGTSKGMQHEREHEEGARAIPKEFS